jgi:hypothetical protein
MMLAQRYPEAFDGIISGAPGLNLNEVFLGTHWPQQIMNELGEYPAGCEIDAITAAAVETCDTLDGVEDGLISDPVECLAKFDPFSVVGNEIKCQQKDGKSVRISEAAAKTVNATWHGIETVEGQLLWPGLMPGTDLTGNDPKTAAGAVAGTNCATTPCTGNPSPFGQLWISLFIEKGKPGLDVPRLNRTAFTDLLKAGRNEFLSILGTYDPDLSRFKRAGGKLISYHGLVSHISSPSCNKSPPGIKLLTSAIPNRATLFSAPKAPRHITRMWPIPCRASKISSVTIPSQAWVTARKLEAVTLTACTNSFGTGWRMTRLQNTQTSE